MHKAGAQWAPPRMPELQEFDPPLEIFPPGLFPRLMAPRDACMHAQGKQHDPLLHATVSSWSTGPLPLEKIHSSKRASARSSYTSSSEGKRRRGWHSRVKASVFCTNWGNTPLSLPSNLTLKRHATQPKKEAGGRACGRYRAGSCTLSFSETRGACSLRSWWQEEVPGGSVHNAGNQCKRQRGSSAGAPSLAQSREDRLRDSFSECYCLSPSLGALSCKANAWIWVGPLGEGASEPPRRRLLRLLALSNEQEKPPGASCQCWMEALAVPHPGGRASPQEGLPNPEAAREAPDTATSPHSERPPHDGAPFSEPVLFLPPHVLSALGLTPGEGFVEIWQASEFDSRPPLSTPALPEAFRRLPMASHCQLQQLAAPPNDSWNLLGASLGGPPEGQASPQEIHELLNDFFCVPRLLTVGDVFGVLRKPYRYGAPCCRAPCNAGAPAGTRPFSGGCPCCLSLHEIEHAEAFGLGPFRCERLASKVLFEAGTSVNGGPLFCVCASEASERPLGTEEAQGKGQTDSSRNSPGGPSAPHEPSPEEAKAGAPTLRRRRRAFGCRGGKGGPLCHWEAADPLFGCGCGETLHQVAVLFRVAALEGPQERLSCAVVVRRGTDLLLQEALAKEGPPPFGVSILTRTGSRGSVLLCGAPGCGAPFLVQRICNALGFHYVSMNCHALAPSVAEAAAAKGITHSDGTTAPGGNSLLSAALVEGSSGGAPCIILLQHVSALMCDPGAPASRLDRLDSLLAAHLRWFLRSHEQQGPPGLLRAPVLVVGVCDSESEGVTDGLGPELRSAFELTVQVQRPDRETREEAPAVRKFGAAWERLV
ncbi:uncharacterized protein LOC113147233 [Cyclospora cayetanensis]|uniref:Uncharacterized protein LOC113147233 n=1 Tax=Cyclospora cayetanensis TaxID=88456 RepID=A0A6P6RYE6_9EIME|nr:uncharacterized protein LOC113147233 [Cyclospora cayetanensis]